MFLDALEGFDPEVDRRVCQVIAFFVPFDFV
jgi:hypothetical protein